MGKPDFIASASARWAASGTYTIRAKAPLTTTAPLRFIVLRGRQAREIPDWIRNLTLDAEAYETGTDLFNRDGCLINSLSQDQARVFVPSRSVRQQHDAVVSSDARPPSTLAVIFLRATA